MKYLCLILAVCLIGCGTKEEQESSVQETTNTQLHVGFPSKEIYRVGDTIEISVPTGHKWEVRLAAGELKPVETTDTLSLRYIVVNAKLGKHKLIVSEADTQTKRSKTITLMSSKKVVLGSYEIVNTYPHDNNAYTQGLEYQNGIMYESTGLNGKSSVRKVEYKTGKVIQGNELDPSFFGEGIGVTENEIIQLTWQARKGFVYDKETFQFKRVFNYPRDQEGWGIDVLSDSALLMTDGSERIYSWETSTFKELGFISVADQNQFYDKLNEIEIVGESVYANVYREDIILKIDRSTGEVLAKFDLSGIMKKEWETPEMDVLNGIAYHSENNTFFVTGKNWSRLFEIRLIE